ncbi:MAG TPA: hypothetical protein VGB95_03375 [Chitinophagales bacterium]
MKQIIVTVIIGFLFLASCKKETENSSQTPLTTAQMLLLGTSDSNNVTATATYRLDSAIILASDSSVPLGSDVYLSTFTKDSISDFIDGTLWQTYSYSVQNDSVIYLYGDGTCNHKRLFTITAQQLKMKSFNPNNNCQQSEIDYFTKQ